MKTLKNLEEMKNKSCEPFGNQYDYFFARLEDYYISKLDGLDRINAELQNWDDESKLIIVNKLIEIISKSGIIGFNKNELLSLIK